MNLFSSLMWSFSHLEINFWHFEFPLPTVHHPLPFPPERCRSKSIMSAMGLCIEKFYVESKKNWLVPNVSVEKNMFANVPKTTGGKFGFWFWSFSSSKFNCMVVENLLNVCISMMGEKSLQKNFKDPNAKNINDIYKKWKKVYMLLLHFLFVQEIPPKVLETATFQTFCSNPPLFMA